MIKKITFLGNFDVPHSSESHYLKTFEKMGIEVIALREAKTPVETIREYALQSDMFFWVHTHGWETPGIPEVLKELGKAGIPSVGYHLDLWLGIERQKDLQSDPYWHIDYFFSVDPQMVDLLNATNGMPKAFYLKAGVFEDECYMAEPDKTRFPHDIIFVGSKGYHKEWSYRPKLINWLAETYGEQFGHYGGDGLGTIRNADLNTLYASAKIVIGDTLCPGFSKPYYFSDRLYETPGRGGFMIFPYIKGLEDSFVLDRANFNTDQKPAELAMYEFDDFAGLKEAIDFYLQRKELREFIRQKGFERVKRDHTYTNRLTELLKQVEFEVMNK